MAVAEMHLLLYGWVMCLNINDISLGIHSQKNKSLWDDNGYGLFVPIRELEDGEEIDDK